MSPATVADVVTRMRAIAAEMPAGDGAGCSTTSICG